VTDRERIQQVVSNEIQERKIRKMKPLPKSGVQNFPIPSLTIGRTLTPEERLTPPDRGSVCIVPAMIGAFDMIIVLDMRKRTGDSVDSRKVIP